MVITMIGISMFMLVPEPILISSYKVFNSTESGMNVTVRYCLSDDLRRAALFTRVRAYFDG